MAARTRRRSLILTTSLVLFMVFLLALIWEFGLEGMVFSGEIEGIAEKWEYVVTSVLFSALALVIPIFLLERAETKRSKLEEQSQGAQRLEALGNLAGGVAHEMNNVLAVVLGLGSVLEKEMEPDDPKSHDIQEIISAARRGKSLVENLLGFARKGEYQRQNVSLNNIVNRVVGLLRHTVPKQVVVNTSLGDHLYPIEGDPTQMVQTVMNLCLNSADALDGRGTITISTSNEVLGTGDASGLEEGQYVKLQVRDDGTGMNEETHERAFEPFFTTKPVGKGTGLGLPMVYGVVQNHGGEVTIDSGHGEGTTVTVLLPAFEWEEAQEAQKVSRPSARKSKAKVLFVDDEEMIRTMAMRMIRAAGYDVLLADGGASALDAYRNHAQTIDLVVLDLSMPNMDGAECFEKLREIDPSVRVYICTGHGEKQVIEEMLSDGALGIIRKPFSMDELSEAIAGATGVARVAD